MTRNERVKRYITDKLDHVSQLDEAYFTKLKNFTLLKDLLHKLIFVKPMGFRGIVATAIVGKYLNPDYNPLTDFYACNPRAIFENGIFYAFENRIPCGKSDPLNVAKNIQELNESWAKGKRPESAAQSAVDYLRHIESASDIDREMLIDFFFFKLIEYSKTITSINILPYGNEYISNQTIASNLSRLVVEFPEGGTIPQIVIHKLLVKLYEHSSVKVMGGESSVFGTNTTSKKPADIWLEISGIPILLLEVTVKKIDFKRLDDCIQSLNALNLFDRQVHFICRLPEDINTLTGVMNNALTHKAKTFDFVDIASFIQSICCLLTAKQLEEMIDDLQIFMKDITRHEKTKNGWNKIWDIKKSNL